MEKRCLQCGKMMEVPEGEVIVPVTCPNCGCKFKLVRGTLLREKQNSLDLGKPEEEIEKRKYAPVSGERNGELPSERSAESKSQNGFFAKLKRMFGF